MESRVVKVPQLSDLRESGAIDQDADVVLFLHRPGYYDKSLADNTTCVVAAKQRQGATGVVELGWNGRRTEFFQRPELFDDL